MTRANNSIREKVIKGLDLTSKRLLQTKKERNLDLVISDKGKVVKIKGKDL